MEWHTWPEVPSEEDSLYATFLVHYESESLYNGKWLQNVYTALCVWYEDDNAFVCADADVDPFPAKPSADTEKCRNERIWWAEVNAPKGSKAFDVCIDRAEEMQEWERERRAAWNYLHDDGCEDPDRKWKEMHGE